MSIKLGKPKESKIQLNLTETKNETESNKLQRTENWQKDRLGNWTGSKIKSIMACNSKGGKMSWSDDEKIFEFSKGAIKYIYSRAKERQSGRYLETPTTLQMAYGTKVEPYIIRIAENLLKTHLDPMFKGCNIDPVGFKSYDNLSSLGASSDGLLSNGKAVIECKACCTWESHFDRTFEPVNEKSTDFWQTQLEMLVWNVDKCLYLIAEPPHSLKDYVNEVKTFHEFSKECEVSINTIEASKFHQRAIVKRVEIVENTCTDWIAKGGNLKDIFYQNLEKAKSDYYENGFSSQIDSDLDKVKSTSNRMIDSLTDAAKESSISSSTLETPPSKNDVPF